MRIAIAQLNATVGDIASNVSRIIDFAQRARAGGADVMVTPELAICGYPPEDLLLREDFMARCDEALAELARRVRGVTLVVGHPRTRHSMRYNSASVLRDGDVLCTYDKHNLPSYTVFDGDMAGGFGVLKDVGKSLVYALARYRNGLGPVIPERVIARAPSAELRAGQTDEDSLPPYAVLDAILEAYIEDDLAPAQIVALGHSRKHVEDVVRRVRLGEYKRRQAPIGIRVTTRAFGRDWRYPVTNRFRHRYEP